MKATEKWNSIIRKFIIIFTVFGLVLTAICRSEFIIEAKSEGIQTVTVKMAGKKVTKKQVSLTQGKKEKLKVSATPAGSIKSVSYRSSKKSIVSVSKAGKITAEKKGTAKITVDVTGKDGRRKSTWVRIKVMGKESGKHILIAYFSQESNMDSDADAVSHATPSIGNTAAAAREIQKQTDGELFEITTEEKYPVSHSECSEVAKKEFDSEICPKLASHIENINQYDIIFIGYPIWWYREPMAIHSFLEEYDLSGKTVVPFCTSLGEGISKSEKNIAKLCPDSKVLKGLSLETERKDVSGSVKKWLKKIGGF